MYPQIISVKQKLNTSSLGLKFEILSRFSNQKACTTSPGSSGLRFLSIALTIRSNVYIKAIVPRNLYQCKVEVVSKQKLLDCKLAYSVKHNMNMVRNFTISHGINLFRTQSWFWLTYPISSIDFYSITLYYIIVSVCRNPHPAMTAPMRCIGKCLWWRLCYLVINPHPLDTANL